jgi:enoyl-CoA hydratase
MSSGLEHGPASSAVTYERVGSLGLITLSREPFNAYDDLLIFELEQAWRAGADDACAQVLVLQADGKHFCGGALLNGMGQPRPPDAPSMAPWELFSFVRNLPKPTVACVQGGCVGGGQRMVFPCDLIFCSDDAFFSDPTAQLGIGGIQSPLHPWFYGPRIAKEMIWSGTRVAASRLYDMGTVNRLYPRAELRQATHTFAGQIALIDPAVLRQAKRATNITTDIMGMHYITNRMEELMDTDQPLSFGPRAQGQ